ncbi:MAG: hypothetical protein AB1298_05115, partial [Bacteroidota bacterium]
MAQVYDMFLNKWTEEELNTLQEHYAVKGAKYVAGLINRSPNAVQAKAAKLGLRVLPAWSPDELLCLKKNYKKKGAQYVAEKLGKNPNSVLAKAAQLGIRYDGVSPWEKWEDNYLQRHYNDRKKASIARTLKRTIPSVVGRAKFLKLRGQRAELWSEKEKNILRELYPDRKNSIAEICNVLKRTRYAVLQQAQYLKINRPVHDHEWTRKEKNYLVKFFDKKSYKEI